MDSMKMTEKNGTEQKFAKYVSQNILGFLPTFLQIPFLSHARRVQGELQR